MMRILVLTAAVVTSGCSAAGAPMIYRQQQVESLQAVATGRLQFDRGCLVLKSADDEWAVAWPPNTQWSAEDETVSVRPLQARVGSDVSLSGGELPTPAVVEQQDWIVPPSEGCLAVEKFWWASGIQS